jgi:signal transduction histidine kinase
MNERAIQYVAKCLVVDDREENRLALRGLLRADDVELVEARSGREALELLLEHEFALILLDVQMPEMDGFEVAELVRGSERTRDVPIIFITAGAHDQSRVFKGYETGAVDFLHKPVDPVILRNKASVFFELHRRKQRIARELREREEALHLNEMFIAVLGHDLRSPLSAVRLGVDLLNRSSTDAGVREIAGRIHSSTTHMVGMIEDLLDVARARKNDGLPVDRSACDAFEIAKRVVQEVRLLHPAREIALSHQGNAGGSWDAGRLRQLVTNLAGNSLRHGLADSPVRIFVDGSRPGRVEIVVGNGGEIPPDKMESIFDPFRASSRFGRRHEGLGLGLYIARQIALAHGGSIELRSNATEGVIAKVLLPRG